MVDGRIPVITAAPPATSLVRRLRQVARVTGPIVALVGAGHLVAWLSGYMSQRGFSTITMKTNTAMCLMLSGIALAIVSQGRAGMTGRWLGRIMAATAAMVGLLTLSENVVGWDLGIDQLLATEPPGALAVAAPNRMGIPASSSFALAGLALLILSRKDSKWQRAANFLALGVCLIAMLGTIGYLYGAQTFFAIARYTGIAWPTAAALLALGLGLLLARPADGLMAQVTADDPGGANLRRWLPVLLLPVLLGWLRLAGERAGLFDPATGTAMMMIAFIVALSVIAYRAARPVSHSAAALRRQREWLQVTLTSIGDAVLATDTEGKITFLNPVAEGLTGWKDQEVIGQPVQSVFRIINEQTREQADDIVARVLRDGATIALANHTAIQSRDGREIPIEDSAAPIKDAEGKTTGAVLVFHDVTQKRRAQEALRESEQRVRRKLESLLSPEGELDALELADLLDVQAIQKLMDDFHALSRFPMAIIDLHGKVVVGVGWQRICTQFHRAHPELCKHCVESDTELTNNVPPGEFRLYQCKNGLWDVATPIVVGGRHVGNLFTGQFFLDDQVVDRDFFRAQASRYGLDEAAYMAALDAVPHMSREKVEACMSFLTKLAHSLSQLSYSNVKLARLLSERDRLTDSLRENETRLRRFYESGLLGVIYWNMNGQITDANDKFLEMVGYDRQDLAAGRIDWANMTPPEYRYLDEQSVVELRASGVNKVPLEKVYIRKDGTRLPVLIAGAMLDEARSNGVAFVLDITDRKRVEEALRNTVQDLERSNRELEQFAYISAHDLQEPLRQVQAYVGMLEDRHADKFDGRAAQYFDFVREGAARMSDLVAGLLAYSRVGAADRKQGPVSCNAALDTAVANLQISINEAHAHVTHDELPTVAADPTQLTQLFQNLVGNAIKFRRDDVEPQVHVGCRREADHHLFWVRDNGIGIDPQHQDKIFLIFKRLHGPGKYSGTGIGLAICKKIVEQHGGRIWIESRVGEGCTFYFTLGGEKRE